MVENVAKIIRSLPKLEQSRLQRELMAQDGLNFYNAMTSDFTQHFWDWVEDRLKGGKNVILQFYGTGGTGKSFSMLYAANKIDSFFKGKLDLDRVFFQIGDVSQDLKKIGRQKSISIDERMPNYGLGSSRLAEEFNSIIETAREPQNSILVSSFKPYLSDLAQWLLETMFIYDGHVYFALREPSMHVHGYVKIPHPKTTMGQKFLDDYLVKKQKFNAQLRHDGNYDPIADMAKKFIDSKDFRAIEERFEGKKKGIPTSILLELVADKYPELRRNVEAEQVVVRIRTEQIKKGAWEP